MNPFEAQSTLFADKPARLALQRLALEPLPGAAAARRLRVNVWRNHAIEPILALAEPYFAWAGLAPQFHLGDYDDSLQFRGHQGADLELLWLDADRYGDADEWLAWLAQRLQVLRTLSHAPIVLATWPAAAGAARLQALVDTLPGVRCADLQAFADEQGVKLLDPRTAKTSGTPLAGALHARLARKLACHWLAACVLPPVKAVAVDLDHTLHDGVLGEAGVRGVLLSPAHAALQTALKQLQRRGVFIALVSRNDAADVQALFEQRSDYPLRWDDFSAREVSWQPKARALQRVASQLNIGTDAIVFVDDNLGELLDVNAHLPQTRTLFAHADAELTRRALDHTPGLWRWTVGAEDSARFADVQANQERQALLRQAGDPAAYFRELCVAVELRVDPIDQLDRLAELSSKTNQFNLALRRLGHAELAQRMRDAHSHVVSVRMRDRLTDSGVVGLVVAQRAGSRLAVIELCISCRALGRGLESTLVVEALRCMPLFDACDEVVFNVAHGPRNQPARQWLESWLGRGELAAGEHPLAADVLRNFSAPPGLALHSGEPTHAT